MEIIFLSDVLLASIALIWLFVAVMQDIKKREVANWLNFSLVAIALAIRAIAAIISSEAHYFLYGIAALAIFFIIANIFYYARIFAGGDAKLLIALATAFATTPVFAAKSTSSMAMFANLPFMAVFLINVLFIGSVYGILWSIFLASTHFKPFKGEFKKINKKMKTIRILCLIAFVILIFASIITKENLLLVLSIMFLFFPYLIIFVKAVENSCMIKAVSAKELTEGDWLFKSLKIKKNVILPKWEGLTAKEIALIKKSKIKKVIIKQGIPFTPVFLIALIISFFTNLLAFLLGFFI